MERGVVRYLFRMDLVWFALVLLLAEVVGTVGGFGSSMLVMPIAGWFLPFTEALGLTAVFHVFSNVAKVILFRSGFSWRVFVPMVLPAMAGVCIGARLTGVADEAMLTLALGLLLVLLSGVFLLFPTARVEPTTRNAVLGGGISGWSPASSARAGPSGGAPSLRSYARRHGSIWASTSPVRWSTSTRAM